MIAQEVPSDVRNTFDIILLREAVQGDSSRPGPEKIHLGPLAAQSNAQGSPKLVAEVEKTVVADQKVSLRAFPAASGQGVLHEPQNYEDCEVSRENLRDPFPGLGGLP